MERFRGKVAVVTGSSAGIGAAICKELVKHGLTVIGLARRLEKLEELAKEISNDGNQSGKFFPLKCDVSKETDIENSFYLIVSKFGPIAILINNAAVAKPSLLCDTTADSISKIYDTNVKAVILCSKNAIKNMNDNHIDGHIININSIAGHYILSFKLRSAVYTSSKHALTVISESLRRELQQAQKDIKVTNLSPGLVVTQMTKSLPECSSPKTALEPKHIADACITVLNTPPNVLVSELTIMPIGQDI